MFYICGRIEKIEGCSMMALMETSRLLCEECGNEMLIPRKRGWRREKGHVKHMYCYKCGKVTGFIEGVAKDKAVLFWDEWHESNAGEEN